MTAGVSRKAFVLPRPTAWHLFVLLLVVALGSEYWEKDPASIAGAQVPWPRFLLALSVVPLLIPASDRRWSAVLRVPGVLAPLLLFWLWCGFSIVSVLAAPKGSSVLDFVKTFAHFTVYVGFVYALVTWMTHRRLAFLVRAYYLLGVAAGILSVLQYVHGTFGLFPWLAVLRYQSFEYAVGDGVTAGFRASSIFGEPSWAARYYVHWIALAMAFWWYSRATRHLVALTLFVLAFYVANSLLGYVILGTFIAVLAFLQMWRHNMLSLSQRQKVGIVVALYAAALLAFGGIRPRLPDLIDRSIARVSLILENRGGAAGNRIDGVRAGLEVWKTSPVIGVGFGNIDGHIVPFYRDPEWVLRSRYSSDSTFVQILAELGIVGLAAFLWFWIRLVSFSAPFGFLEHASDSAARAYVWVRFLQIDLIAQAAGMINSADYLNPHFWTIVAIALSCRALILRESRAQPVAGFAPALASPLECSS